MQQDVAAACLVQRVEEEQRVFHLTENEVVTMFNEPTLITEHCPSSDQPQRATQARGTYRIKWKAGCRLQTPDFSITAAVMPVGHRTVIDWHVPNGAINLVGYFKNRTYTNLIPPIIPLNLDTLPLPPVIYWPNQVDIFSIITWVVVAVLALCVGLLLWRKVGDKTWCKVCWDKIKTSARSKSREIVPDTVMLSSLGMDPSSVTQADAATDNMTPNATRLYSFVAG